MTGDSSDNPIGDPTTGPSPPGYRLLDTGDGSKLEAFGPVRLARPAPQVLWPRGRPEAWSQIDGHYERSSSGGGRWHWTGAEPAPWEIDCGGLRMGMQATGFGHVGVFPEQIPFWRWIAAQSRMRPQPRVLNLFAYTGGSSLAAAGAGAQVTHCDASKGVVTWARENAQRNGLGAAPIRWIVDDATKFLKREHRRERAYDGIVLDPPSFGRGSKGEVWKLERDLPELLEVVAALLSPEPAFVLLSAHTPGITPLGLRNVLGQALGPRPGTWSWGEMSIAESRGRCDPALGELDGLERRGRSARGRHALSAEVIRSLQNPRVKELVRLQRRRERQRTGRLRIDGARELGQALDAGLRPDVVFVCDERIRTDEARDVLRRVQELRLGVQGLAPPVYHKVAYGDRDEGVCAVLTWQPSTLEELAPSPAPLLLVLEGLEKPGNLGAALRSADAAGVEAVILCDAPVDPTNPNAVRASMGTVFRVPLAATTGEALAPWLQAREIRILAADPAASLEYFRVDLTGGVALVVGAEHPGLSPLWKRGGHGIRIPMAGSADSLNASVAAAILMFEAQRQRRT